MRSLPSVLSIPNAKTGETLKGMLRWKAEGVSEGAAAKTTLALEIGNCIFGVTLRNGGTTLL